MSEFWRLQDISENQNGRVCIVEVGPEDNGFDIGRISATGRGQKTLWRAEFLAAFTYEPVTDNAPTQEDAAKALISAYREWLRKRLDAIELAHEEAVTAPK